MMEELGDASAARRVRSLSDLLGKRLSSMRSGQDLAADADFQELVALLADHADARQRLRWLVQSPDALRCAALAAIVRAGDRSHKAVASLIDPGLTIAATYALFILVLLFRPQGMFGRATT